MSVRLVPSVGERLVYKSIDYTTRMRPHEFFHLFGLSYAFGEFRFTHYAEQRQIGLNHNTQSIAIIVNLFLNGALCQTQKIHIAEFSQQNIVDKLIKIAVHYVLLFEPHSVRSAKFYLLTVEIKSAFRYVDYVLRESSYAELTGFNLNYIAVSDFYDDFIKPRRIVIPDFSVFDLKRNFENIILVFNFGFRAEINPHVFEYDFFEILPVNAYGHIYILTVVSKIVHVDPRFKRKIG